MRKNAKGEVNAKSEAKRFATRKEMVAELTKEKSIVPVCSKCGGACEEKVDLLDIIDGDTSLAKIKCCDCKNDIDIATLPLRRW